MRSFRVTSLRRFITAGLFLAGVLPLTAQTTYRFTLDGSQTAPATASRAQGWGIAVLDAGQTTLTLNLAHIITGATVGHIHQAVAGSRGLDVFTLASVASPISQSFTMTPALVTALNSDQLYIDLHSGSYPAGEIRAQIVAVTTRFPLEGVQETPATGSTC